MVESERTVKERQTFLPAAAATRAALIGAYLAAAVLGYSLAVAGAFGGGAAPAPATPLARVGFALRAPNPTLGKNAWAQIGQDVASVRAALKAEQREVFDFVSALRGLNNAGASEWARAEEICRALLWQRCDRAALQGLDLGGRP